MNGFDPGEGWRRLSIGEIVDEGAEVLNYSTGSGIRTWVREAPMPPLPTEPYTVIRAWWGTEASTDLCLTGDGVWASQHGPYDADDMAALVRFEVLASPANQWDCIGRMEQVKHDTAKAVIDRVRAHVEDQGEDPDHPMFGLHAIAREFGVSS